MSSLNFHSEIRRTRNKLNHLSQQTYNSHVIKSSTIVEHSYNTKHQICLEKSKLLATIPHHFKRKIREALEIEKYPNNKNRDNGLNLKNPEKRVVEILKNKTKIWKSK